MTTTTNEYPLTLSRSQIETVRSLEAKRAELQAELAATQKEYEAAITVDLPHREAVRRIGRLLEAWKKKMLSAYDVVVTFDNSWGYHGDDVPSWLHARSREQLTAEELAALVWFICNDAAGKQK